MTQLRHLMDELLDDPTGTPPPSALSADAVYATGRRRSLLGSVARTATVVMTIAAVGGTAYGAAHFTPRGGLGTADGATRVTLLDVTADGNHLYAGLSRCTGDAPASPGPDDPPADPGPSGGPGGPGESCTFSLMASDDAGRSWTERAHEQRQRMVRSPRSGALRSRTVGATGMENDEVSTDGGRTWRPVTDRTQPVPAVPDGGWVEMADTGPVTRVNGSPIVAVDPRTGVRAPLANQPPFAALGLGRSTRADVIVATGRTGLTRMMAISRDGGRTWTAHQLPARDPAQDTVPISLDPPLITDGATLYLDKQVAAGRSTISVSTDDGATWTDRQLPAAAQGGIWSSYLATDGTHVVTTRDDSATVFWVSRNNGQYERLDQMNGLPAGFLGLVDMAGPGGYVTLDSGSTAFYRSTDGLNWTHVTIR